MRFHISGLNFPRPRAERGLVSLVRPVQRMRQERLLMKRVLGTMFVHGCLIAGLAGVQVCAQDNPLASVSEMQVMATNPVVSPPEASVQPVETEADFDDVGREIVLTGRVRVLRDKDTYRVVRVSLEADDGKEYTVLLDGEGRKLARVLKSRIVRVRGRMKEFQGLGVFCVESAEVIGIARKAALAPVAKPVAEPERVSLAVTNHSGTNAASGAVAALTAGTNSLQGALPGGPGTNVAHGTNQAAGLAVPGDGAAR